METPTQIISLRANNQQALTKLQAYTNSNGHNFNGNHYQYVIKSGIIEQNGQRTIVHN